MNQSTRQHSFHLVSIMRRKQEMKHLDSAPALLSNPTARNHCCSSFTATQVLFFASLVTPPDQHQLAHTSNQRLPNITYTRSHPNPSIGISRSTNELPKITQNQQPQDRQTGPSDPAASTSPSSPK
ncbi:hypothetical protein Droror1_Dr00012796 [Drosera rotundifolia]